MYNCLHCIELQELLQLKKKKTKKKKPMDMSAIEAQIDVSAAIFFLNILLLYCTACILGPVNMDT